MGIDKTVEEFRKRFYFPNFTEYLTSTIQNCLQCLQLKRVPSKNLKTSLQSLSSLKCDPDEMLQVDLVGPLQSPLYRYVLTGIDIFTQYMFSQSHLLKGNQKLFHENLCRYFSAIVTFQKQSYRYCKTIRIRNKTSKTSIN